MHYVARWRVLLEARALRDTRETVGDGVGYASVAAFSRAFNRFMRVSPTAYRNQVSRGL